MFISINNYTFISVINKKNIYFNYAGTNRELWVAITRESRFVRANLHTGEPVSEFYVVDASDGQVGLIFRVYCYFVKRNASNMF